MSSLCKNLNCEKMVNAPYYYCYECILERKSALTGRCTTCSRCIKPDFKKWFSCFDKEKPQDKILRNPHPKIDLRETVNAAPYEPQAWVLDRIGFQSTVKSPQRLSCRYNNLRWAFALSNRIYIMMNIRMSNIPKSERVSGDFIGRVDANVSP